MEEILAKALADAQKRVDALEQQLATNRLSTELAKFKSKKVDQQPKVNVHVFAYEVKPEFLINNLTLETFDSISDQIIEWANESEKEKDGRTLIQVLRLVFEKAIDDATWSEMYARLCRKMLEQISPKVQDDGIKNADGKPIAGGHLFRKYLLNRCQEDFERDWVNKETTAAAAATKASEDQAAKEIDLYYDEYYAAQKATNKRRGLGLIKFIGELFKLQMLTERLMHECVKKLLGNVEDPEEEDIEWLCELLTTVGQMLDTTKARAHMDVYFGRMKELTKSPNVSSRMQLMLQDIIELRERKWTTRNTVAAPTTIAKIHEAVRAFLIQVFYLFSHKIFSIGCQGEGRAREGVLQPNEATCLVDEEDVTEEPEQEMSEEEAKKKIGEDTKEFFAARSLDGAEAYFSKLPSSHHHSLVDKLVSFAIESKPADATLVGDLFLRASSKKLCSSSAFEAGFISVAEFLDDILVDAPKATDLLATMIKGAELSEEQRTNISSKSAEYGTSFFSFHHRLHLHMPC
ncbi:ARM repeat-containing protein [Gymnopus androsaceus JB14]|uniref:ARM repeat-containing protein n=1 Tax=Gymnopus androsaceus JB14 TaxID=1447944 RepID=A0A6A4GQJ1_9AGAR|nr:ARM repeat-containing protein [Gymnopus androsaceus JB14]